MPRQFLKLLAPLILLLFACDIVTGNPAAAPTTAASFETAVAQTVAAALNTAQAQTAAAPSATALPTLTPAPVESAFAPGNPTAIPATALLTPWPALPAEAILILSPGPASQITSPVTVTGIADPTFENNLSVEIQNERGEVIGVGYATIQTADVGQRGPFVGLVEFTPPAEPQPGRLVVSDRSARDGHVIHLASVFVTLLPTSSASGAPDIKSALEEPEKLTISLPAIRDVISGGSVHVAGFSAPTFEQALALVVLDADGAVVGRGFTTLQTPAGEPGSFTADVAYSVTSEQPGSVQVYSTSPRDGAIEHLVSVEVILRP